jgi:hypothetical protein
LTPPSRLLEFDSGGADLRATAVKSAAINAENMVPLCARSLEGRQECATLIGEHHHIRRRVIKGDGTSS